VDSPPAAAGFGAPRRHYRTVDSTNERARALAGAGAPHGTVVTAAEQTAGRGRLGRTWTAPPGKALLCSAILRPLTRRASLLPLAVPLAVCEAVESLAPVRCAVKWPNDVWLEERKLAGVLIEARPREEWAVIGVGLNVAIEPGEFPEELRETATSVGAGSVEEALRALCTALERWVAADPEQVLEAYRGRDALRGREISWQGGGSASPSGSGVAAGIADDGNLLVEPASGERLSLGAGDVSLNVG
jgi:BirA family biotin operon repressor/biotin-[acetyl-CoA-carboxylase] ligase